MKDTIIDTARKELTEFFQSRSIRNLPTDYRHPLTTVFQKLWNDHPNRSRYAFKAEMYRQIADYITPKLFTSSPFYFCTDIFPADWENNAACPGFFLREHPLPDADLDSLRHYGKFFRNGLGYTGIIDSWHYCPDYTRIINHGFQGIYAEILQELPKAKNDAEREFLETAKEASLAIRRTQTKFLAAARQALLRTDLTVEQRSNLTRIAQTAQRIPWEPPTSFYEGLETLLFVREVANSFDGIHIDIVGHPDRQLEHLYKRDIETGQITQDQAYQLIRLFLMVNDCKQDNHELFDYATQTRRTDETNEKRRPLAVVNEINATMTLGGCHEDGSNVAEDLTLMFLKAHREDGLIFPKPLCRYNAHSSPEYLHELNTNFLTSRSVLALVNDDAIIPAQVAAGKSIEDARRYQVGGCWEITLEGREDSSGVTTYINLAKIMELSINTPPEMADELQDMKQAVDFQDAVRRFLHNVEIIMKARCNAISRNGANQLSGNPCPMFSIMLADCIKNHRDYTRGGGRYNPHANPFFAFANVVDSLMAIRNICFGDKDTLPLKEFLNAVNNNWNGAEDIRQRALHSPFWGDNQPETNQLAAQIHQTLAHAGEGIPNERGGHWQTAFYVYREMISFAQLTAATPDGRHDGDWLAQGITPSRLHPLNAVTNACLSLGHLDSSITPGNRLFDINLPINSATYESLDAFERVAATQGIGMLQLNCISREQLLDAQRHPEKYENLIVRLCGYSARFVTLPRLWQDEFISRAING